MFVHVRAALMVAAIAFVTPAAAAAQQQDVPVPPFPPRAAYHHPYTIREHPDSTGAQRVVEVEMPLGGKLGNKFNRLLSKVGMADFVVRFSATLPRGDAFVAPGYIFTRVELRDEEPGITKDSIIETHLVIDGDTLNRADFGMAMAHRTITRRTPQSTLVTETYNDGWMYTSTLVRMAAAKSVKGTLAARGKAFELTAEQIEALKDFASRVAPDPAAIERAVAAARTEMATMSPSAAAGMIGDAMKHAGAGSRPDAGAPVAKPTKAAVYTVGVALAQDDSVLPLQRLAAYQWAVPVTPTRPATMKDEVLPAPAPFAAVGDSLWLRSPDGSITGARVLARAAIRPAPDGCGYSVHRSGWLYLLDAVRPTASSQEKAGIQAPTVVLPTAIRSWSTAAVPAAIRAAFNAAVKADRQKRLAAIQALRAKGQGPGQTDEQYKDLMFGETAFNDLPIVAVRGPGGATVYVGTAPMNDATGDYDVGHDYTYVLKADGTVLQRWTQSVPLVGATDVDGDGVEEVITPEGTVYFDGVKWVFPRPPAKPEIC